jgi:hypothetical protein
VLDAQKLDGLLVLLFLLLGPNLHAVGLHETQTNRTDAVYAIKQVLYRLVVGICSISQLLHLEH